MKFLAAVVLLTVVLASTNSPNTEAPAGFDNKSNGMVDDATHPDDQAKFDDTETVADGLGPLYNAQSCRECHQNPTSGGTSQVAELRVGHQGPDHLFHNPDIPVAHGGEIITGRTLVNDRAICPNAAFRDTEIQEQVFTMPKQTAYGAALGYPFSQPPHARWRINHHARCDSEAS